MMLERYQLSTERIREIGKEEMVREPFLSYFKEGASLLLYLQEVCGLVESKKYYQLQMEQLKEINNSLYSTILPSNYHASYANPTYMVRLCAQFEQGKLYGQYLSFLYTELRGLIPYAFENTWEIITIYQELFVEIYGLFVYAQAEDEENVIRLPSPEEIRQSLYWFESDNCDVLVPRRLDEQLNPDRNFAAKLICNANLDDLRYLYFFGEYITENECKIATYLNSLPQEQIDTMADTFTEGYRIGFVRGNKDIKKKSVVNIRYCLGFERIVKKAIDNFHKMGLESTIYRAASLSLNKRGQLKIGYYGAIPNKQYEFDHREDEAIYLDHDFVNRKVSVLKSAFEMQKELAGKHGGPAVMEVFGENPFQPETKEEANSLDNRQQKLSVEYAEQSGQLTNQYIIGEERSFTIISYPTPEFGDIFEDVFADTVIVNTLDYTRYQRMQQILIDELDKAETVKIVGRNDNDTNLTVALYRLGNPQKETIFENCVADVNIPVGEVFTSPVLKGTEGLLHVKEIFLDGLKYIDLRLRFENGRVAEYSCRNYADEAQNKKYIKDNLLFHHETLPMGEFAIGTNTTAYRMARKYHIQDRLPVLISEKTGPHFAVGDTCYSYEEDVKSYNPDGKEIVARANEISELRKENPKEAYFHCHTDITIPYEELGGIYAVHSDGSMTALIEDGRFMLTGLEELNKPLKKI